MARAGTVGLLAAVLIGLAAPAIGQESRDTGQATQTAAQSLTIPFAPPLGTPTRYAIRFERKRPSGDSVIDFEQQLTFDSMDGGYVLRIETLAFVSGGRRFDLADKRLLDAVPAALRIYLLPITVELDASGEMVRMRDWEAMRVQLRGLPEAAAQLSGAPMTPAAAAAVAQVLDPIINASAEDAPAFMIRGWPAVLGYGGAEFDLGEMAEAESLISGGILPEPVPATLQGSLNRTPAGNLRLVQTAVIDPEGLRDGVLSLLERLRSQGAGKTAPDPAEAIAAITMTDDTEIEFDAVTGLPIAASMARLTQIGGGAGLAAGTGGEIVTIRRIAP
jgi:hypothetical protein